MWILRRELERVAADKEKVVVIKVLRGIHTCYLEIEPNWKANPQPKDSMRCHSPLILVALVLGWPAWPFRPGQ